jgi:hypothetical protein
VVSNPNFHVAIDTGIGYSFFAKYSRVKESKGKAALAPVIIFKNSLLFKIFSFEVKKSF